MIYVIYRKMVKVQSLATWIMNIIFHMQENNLSITVLRSHLEITLPLLRHVRDWLLRDWWIMNIIFHMQENNLSITVLRRQLEITLPLLRQVRDWLLLFALNVLSTMTSFSAGHQYLIRTLFLSLHVISIFNVYA